MLKIGCGCLGAAAAIIGSFIASIFMVVCFLCLKACELVKGVVTEETEIVSVKTIDDSVNIDVSTTNGVIEAADVQPIETHYEVHENGNYVDTMLTISSADDNSEVVALEIIFSDVKKDLVDSDRVNIVELADKFNAVNRPKMIALRHCAGRYEDFELLKGKIDLVSDALREAGVDETLIQQDAPDQGHVCELGRTFIQVNVRAK